MHGRLYSIRKGLTLTRKKEVALRICNDCNEVTPRLARVAKNALLNGDFPRVIGILDRLSAPGPR